MFSVTRTMFHIVISLALCAVTQSRCLAHGLAITPHSARSVLNLLPFFHHATPQVKALDELLRLEISKKIGPADNLIIKRLEYLRAASHRIEGVTTQAKAAAAAPESAFAAVPPPVIVSNRALLAALVATNFFGLNTLTISALEADYVERWLQDVEAMIKYKDKILLLHP
jgi:hypothetical protein